MSSIRHLSPVILGEVRRQPNDVEGPCVKPRLVSPLPLDHNVPISGAFETP
jgi:hypothetical protein